MKLAKNDISVFVGVGQGGQNALTEAIRNEGFSARPVFPQWPRDHYVFFNGSYVTRQNRGPRFRNLLGEGGNFLTGDEYLLVGDSIGHLVNEFEALLLDDTDFKKESLDDMKKRATLLACQKAFPTARVHVIPSGRYDGRGHNHLDMSVMLVPNNRLLIVDMYVGHYAAKGNEIDVVGEREKLKVIRYDGSQNGTQYDLNTLVLPSEQGDVVFVDSHAKSLISLLEKENTRVVPVEMPQKAHPQGKIHCMTNIVIKSDIERIKLLENA